MPTPPLQGATLWVSPSLPQAFLAHWDEATLSVNGFEIVQDPVQALVQVVPDGPIHLSTWVYALVAPFPTIDDDVTWEDLQKLWGEEQGGSPLFVSTETLPQLEFLLGPSAGNVRVVPQESLLEITWAQKQALAIVPFEELQPRWKVLTLDGQSPIRKDFMLEGYPLKLAIGVVGPEGTLEGLVDVLPIPASNYDPDQITVLVMTGVTALTRATAWQMERRGIGYPAEKIGHWLADADLTHISNEVPFAEDCPYPDPVQEGLKFCSDPAYIELLDIIGTDIIELTGNHVRDYGSGALVFTLNAYAARGWGTFGGGMNLDEAFEPYRIDHNGNHFAFLGCNFAGPKYAWATENEPGSTPCDSEALMESVAALQREGYQVIFTYQWAERNTVLEDQRETFAATADAGAVIVSGSQSHQPLGMAFEGDSFLHYGLGNLFFDQMQTLDMRSVVIDRHVFFAGRYISTELLTAMLESYAQPRPMTVEERAELLGNVFKASGW